MHYNALQHTTTYSGLLQPLVVETLFPSDLSQPERLVEHNQFVPLLPVVPPPLLAATVTPQILSSGSLTTVSVTLRLSGRLPRDGVVQLELPAAFRINDGDTTAVIASSIAGAAGQMSIVSADVHSGVVNVRLDPAAQVSLALSITYFTHSHTHSHTHTHNFTYTDTHTYSRCRRASRPCGAGCRRWHPRCSVAVLACCAQLPAPTTCRDPWGVVARGHLSCIYS